MMAHFCSMKVEQAEVYTKMADRNRLGIKFSARISGQIQNIVSLTENHGSGKRQKTKQTQRRIEYLVGWMGLEPMTPELKEACPIGRSLIHSVAIRCYPIVYIDLSPERYHFSVYLHARITSAPRCPRRCPFWKGSEPWTAHI
jgi:hypothetical protein